MGCMLFKQSRKWCKYRKSSDGILMRHLQLKFTYQQLQQLNNYFSDLEVNQGDANHIRDLCNLEVNIEKLLLHLNFIIGSLDIRFSSTFLVKLDSRKTFFKNSTTFSYLIRLEHLSLPQLYNEISTKPLCSVNELDQNLQGFCKIQLEGKMLKDWIDFVNNDGYLKRDKIQQRYAELLMYAASLVASSKVTEFNSKRQLNCSHSSVVDADVLHHILQIPPEQRLFYGSSLCDTMEIPNFKISLREDTTSITLRIHFPTLNIPLLQENDYPGVIVKLFLGINFVGLSSTSDYPHRILLSDSDILLHQQAATTGFYLIAAEPQFVTPILEDVSILWRFQLPVAEQILCTHYSDYSVAVRAANIIYNMILNIRRTVPGHHVISKYIIKTLLWFQLEKYIHPSYWTSNFLAFHILSLLDELIMSLRTVNYRSFFFPWFNIMINSTAINSFRLEDYSCDSELLETFVRRVYTLSYSELFGYQTAAFQCQYPDYLIKYESALLEKWNILLENYSINEFKNPRKQRIEKIYSVENFSRKHLEYITQIIRGMLFVHSLKSITINVEETNEYNINVTGANELLNFPLIYNHYVLEYIMYIISVMIEQAMRLYSGVYVMNYCRNGKQYEFHAYPLYSARYNAKKRPVYEKAINSFLNNVKISVKDDLLVHEITNDIAFVQYILQLLQIKINGNKFIRCILKPYLHMIFFSSHTNCWFLDCWKTNLENDELKSLCMFAKLLSQKKISPYYGLMDALHKGWQWSMFIVRSIIELNNGSLELLTSTSNGGVIRHLLHINMDQMKDLKYQFLCYNWSFRNRGTHIAEHLFNILKPLNRDENQDELYYENVVYNRTHVLIRNMSPMTCAIDGKRRYGVHKCLGNIIDAFVLLGKFSVLQEISVLLPEEKRKLVLEDIHFISRQKYRSKRVSNMLLHSEKFRNQNITSTAECLQIYRTLGDQTGNESKVVNRRRSLITIASSSPSLLESPLDQTFSPIIRYDSKIYKDFFVSLS